MEWIFRCDAAELRKLYLIGKSRKFSKRAFRRAEFKEYHSYVGYWTVFTDQCLNYRRNKLNTGAL